MTHGGRILIVVPPSPRLDDLRDLLVTDRERIIRAAASPAAALPVARSFHPHAILCEFEYPEMDGIEFCKRIKEIPATSVGHCLLLLPPSGAPEPRLLPDWVDDYVVHPHDETELLAKVAALIRLSRLQDLLERERRKHERVKRELAKTFDRLVGVFEYLIDLQVPGAMERGKRVSEWALKIAARFSVPAHYLDELRTAGRLYEIGRLAQPGLSADRETSAKWSYVVSSGAILEKIHVMEEVGSLIESTYENWDGTGLPNRWCQGQIPLRSRILRVVIDYFEALQRIGSAPGAATRALDELSPHSGTWYDPLVLQHFSALLVDDPDTPTADLTERVPVTELEVGMVLAHDLRTTRGVKLLSEGAVLDAKTLDVVQRRHLSDPIIGGVQVRVGSTAYLHR